MPLSQGNVSVFMGPSQLAVGPGQQGAPDDLEAAIIGFVDRARDTLDVAVQELESENIARALIAAARRDVRVRVVLEEDYLHVRGQAVADAFAPGGRNEANRRVHAALLRGGVQVRSDYNGAIFHQKFVVRDLEGSRAGVLTGSTNFTPTGTHRNLNHLVTVGGKRVAREYAEEFDEIWGGTFGEARLRHDSKPKTATVSRVPVKVLFAPDHAPEMEIMKQMAKARQRVDFAIFTFSRSSGIDDVMLMLARAGVALRGVFDRGQGNQTWSASRILAQAAGAAVAPQIFLADQGQGLGKLHHKLMVIDDRVVIAGSFNYTGPANLLNDENIIILGDLDEQDPARIAVHRRVAAFARAEIDRIIGVYGSAVHPPSP
jgi:phosphatidylserine/phosphatidylglycerophosphate/cardiolipin synthase-like enzyme